MEKPGTFNFFVLIVFFITLLMNCQEDKSNIISPVITEKTSFIHAVGRDLYKGDKLIYLKGTSVGNRVWQNDDWPEEEFGEIDYKRVRDMGMNSIRFLMNYKFFESTGSTGDLYTIKDWAWLDTNISWAAKYGIYLILNVHIPQGFDDSREKAKMAPLWENPENLERFKKMWKAIASKYKDEQMIAGYDILNEPFVPGTIEQWKELAQQTIDSIRTVDTNHTIIIERLDNELGGTEHYDDPDYVFFPVNDKCNNIMYSFHYYYPFNYTHQSVFGNPAFGSYPDTSAAFPEDLVVSTGIYTSPTVAKGSDDWTFLNGDAALFKVTDSALIVGKPVLCAHYIDSGKVFFDDFTVKEYDESGNFTRVITSADIESETNWFKWSQHSDGKSGISSNEHHSGHSSYFLTGMKGYGTGNNNEYRFLTKYGYSYSISGWVKGENVPDSAICRFSIDFEKSSSGKTILMLNKEYLRQQFSRFNQFGIKNNAPIYVGEFGLNYQACKDKGAAAWFNDILDILDSSNVHWTHHIYNGWWFGLYTDENSYGTYVEQIELVNLFRKHLAN